MAPPYLLPASNTQVFLVFLCLQVNAEMFSKFQVATACFSCSPSNLNSSKLSPIPIKFTCFLRIVQFDIIFPRLSVSYYLYLPGTGLLVRHLMMGYYVPPSGEQARRGHKVPTLG
jgi:hypothetical protein